MVIKNSEIRRKARVERKRPYFSPTQEPRGSLGPYVRASVREWRRRRSLSKLLLRVILCQDEQSAILFNYDSVKPNRAQRQMFVNSS